MKQKPKGTHNNLLPGDGMSLGNSTATQRAKVLEKLMDVDLDPSECIQNGFFIGKHYPGPIPDYKRNEVKNEITSDTLKQK